MKYAHIFAEDKNDKFSLEFKKFIEKNFNIRNHNIVVFRKKAMPEKQIEEIVMPRNLGKLNNLLYKSDKIIIHGLFSPLFILILFLQPWLLKKCYWCIWGGDLYFYKYRRRSLTSNCIEFMRKFVIKNISGLITQLKGDYELTKQWYKAKGKYYYSFLYPSNLYKEYDLREIKKDNNKKYIQIGNSACETNEHIEVFQMLSKYKNENIEIICPLSYSGKKEYINQVIKAGYEIFGEEKFVPITEFMDFDKYLDVLARIDIAIFNHKRQRGLGNITTLLGLGKKIYIREEITTWKFCIDHGFKVFSINKGFNDLFEEVSKEIKESNINIMKLKFSETKLVEDWNKIFSEGEVK